MNRFVKKLLAAACVSIFAAGAAMAAAETHVVTDHDGRKVTLPVKIDRAVVTNIFPLASVASVYLGGADKLVGIHSVSMSAAKNGLLSELYPSITKADTSFMTGGVLNVESLLKLKPQVVFVNARDSKTLAQLESAGIPAVSVSTSKWDYDVFKTYDAWISLLSDVFPGEGKATADAVRQYSADIEKRIRSRIDKIPADRRPKALFLFTYDGEKIVTSGKHFFGQFWCDAIGAKNVAEGVAAKNANAVISMEQIYAWNPDIVFITNFTGTQPADLYQNRYGNNWGLVKAVKEKNVFKMPLGTYRTYTPSADTPMTLLWLAKKAYPETFKDVDLNKEVKAYYGKLFGLKLSDREVTRMMEPVASAAAGFRPGL